MSLLMNEFAIEFGIDMVERVTNAAREHGNGVNNRRLGSDPFRHALLICIGYDCFRIHKGLNGPGMLDKVREFMTKHAEYIGKHNGDVDYLALFAGHYDFIAEAAKGMNDAKN